MRIIHTTYVMGTHSKDLLYGTQPSPVPSDDVTDDADEMDLDESGSGVSEFDAGQGSGEEHISFSKETSKKRVGGLLGDEKDPAPVFDDLGNPIPKTEEGDDEGTVSII